MQDDANPRYPLAARARAFKSSDVRELLRRAHLPGMISLAGGLPAAELFDTPGIAGAADAVLRERPATALQYGTTEGQPRLRAALAERLARGGVDLDGRELLVTTGSQQALDLIARALLDDGDAVALERPTYLAALQTFRLSGARFVSMSSDAEGAAVEELESLGAEDRPKLVYVVPDFANPTGLCLSLERRLRLLRWAAAQRVFVLEDDPYGALRTQGQALPSLLRLARSVPGAAAWCGATSTLSKTLAPGLRIGWLVLPRTLADAVSRIKQAFDLHTSSLAQEVAAEYLQSDRLDERLPVLRAAYAERRAALAGALRDRFGTRLRFVEPDGGMFVWGRFGDGTDTRALLEHAIEAGVSFVPGDTFYPDRPDGATLRLNFTGHEPAALVQGVERLASAHARLQRTAVKRVS